MMAWCLIDFDLLDRVFLFAHGPIADGEVVGVFATALLFPLTTKETKIRNRWIEIITRRSVTFVFASSKIRVKLWSTRN